MLMETQRMIEVGQTAPAVEVRGLRIDLPQGGDIVDDVSFTIRAGEILGLVGESGSGKTTVGMALLGFARGGARIVGGTIHIAGDTTRNMADLPEAERQKLRGKVVAYVPQDPASALNPALRIGTQLAEVIAAHEPDATAETVGARIRRAMEDVGLPSDPAYLARYPHQMSGGQQQRVGIAMAVILKPRLIVLDEPTTGLDVTTQNRILDIVRDLCRSHGIGALHVTHDLSVIAHVADRVMVMYSGRIVELGQVETLLQNSAHPYTRALMQAMPELRFRNRLATIQGGAARPDSRRGACFFQPRCAMATAECSTSVVPLRVLDHDHAVRCVRAERMSLPAPVRLPDPAPFVHTAPNAVLEVRNLALSYGTQPVLKNVNFEVMRGECLAIVGESGSGKSSLSRALIGLLPQYTGTVLLDSAALAPSARRRERGHLRRMQYVFQSPHNSLNPRQTVEGILGLVHDMFNRVPAGDRRAAMVDALRQVGLSPDALLVYPDQLSGGERQRVAIARALMANPEVMICDEITSALDVSVQAAIVGLLKELQASRNLTMLFVTHNLALVRNIADRVMVLNRGVVAEIGPVGGVIDTPKDDYTRQLIGNALEADPASRTNRARTQP